MSDQQKRMAPATRGADAAGGAAAAAAVVGDGNDDGWTLIVNSFLMKKNWLIPGGVIVARHSLIMLVGELIIK